ncbi:MAG: hypothetical protein ABJL54_02430 [Halioglobus sp.]
MSKSYSISTVAVEVISIVLAVLLALAVSEWQEDRQNKERSSLGLKAVIAELESNLATLIDRHTQNKATVEAAMAAEETSEDPVNAQFSPAVQVRDTAWNALNATGMSNYLEYELILELSNVYANQAVYRQLGITLMDTAMNMAAMATVSGNDIEQSRFQSQFMAYFQMIIALEAGLIEAYQDVLNNAKNASM